MPGTGAPDIQVVLEIAKFFGAAAGPVALVLYLWYGERTERRELQKENAAMLRESLTVGAAVNKTLAEAITTMNRNDQTLTRIATKVGV